MQWKNGEGNFLPFKKRFANGISTVEIVNKGDGISSAEIINKEGDDKN